MTSGTLTGGCQCGAVRYRLDEPVDDPHLCHCRMCQKAAGNYFLPLGAVRRSAFVVTRGELSWFRSSGPVRRGFCAACGTPLAFDVLAGDRIGLTLGSLDDPAAVRPVRQAGLEARLPWFEALPGLDAEGDPSGWYARIGGSSRQHPDHDTPAWAPPEATPLSRP